MSQPVLWGFVDPQLLERVFQQQCPGMLPITCCTIQPNSEEFVSYLELTAIRVVFMSSGLESVMYFS